MGSERDGERNGPGVLAQLYMSMVALLFIAWFVTFLAVGLGPFETFARYGPYLGYAMLVILPLFLIAAGLYHDGERGKWRTAITAQDYPDPAPALRTVIETLFPEQKLCEAILPALEGLSREDAELFLVRLRQRVTTLKPVDKDLVRRTAEALPPPLRDAYGIIWNQPSHD